MMTEEQADLCLRVYLLDRPLIVVEERGTIINLSGSTLARIDMIGRKMMILLMKIWSDVDWRESDGKLKLHLPMYNPWFLLRTSSNLQRERKWLSREKMRTSALEREVTRNNMQDRYGADKESMLDKLAHFDDDVEMNKATEEYFKDHQLWARKRAEYRRKESEKDQRDREVEERESKKDKNRAAALADSFLDEIGAKVNSDGLAPQPLRLRMTRENVKTVPSTPAKRTVEEVEGLLEEDEDEDYQARSRKKRLLIPLEYDGEESKQGDASKESQLRALVSSIPSDTKGLWEYPVYWEGVDNVMTLL